MTSFKGLTLVSDTEASLICGGEPITLTVVLTYLAISILTVVVWKLYLSTKGKIQFPGGFNFEWTSAYLNPFLLGK